MEEKFEIFALVALFGHKQLAGKVSEVTLAGANFIRIDIPETKLVPAFTRFINPSAVYSMDPITEELMKALAEQYKEQPIASYDIRDVLSRMKAALPRPEAEFTEQDRRDIENF